MKQIVTTGARIRSELPKEWKEGETIEFDGLTMTIDQADKITSVLLLNLALTIQRVNRSEDIVVQTELMPSGMWARFEPDGHVIFPAGKAA